METENCGSCRFYRNPTQCARYPPTLVTQQPVADDRGTLISYFATTSVFPQVGVYDWCGEYEAKDKPPTELERLDTAAIMASIELLKEEIAELKHTVG